MSTERGRPIERLASALQDCMKEPGVNVGASIDQEAR